MANREAGQLYVVATPIGNLGDLSFRALAVLKAVDWIAAEDTRHVRPLLSHYGVGKPVLSLHQHNEEQAALAVLAKLQAGLSVALVADAGTPLISDPGLPLVRKAQAAGIRVVPIPGPCALVAALSVAGLPVSRFIFEGFAPRTSAARRAFFAARAQCPDTWAFYESSHRIVACLQDLEATLPAERELVVARELTKLHETLLKTTPALALAAVVADEHMRKGEFVVLVSGAGRPRPADGLDLEQQRTLKLLLAACPTKTAVGLAAAITGANKKLLYQAALALRQAPEAGPGPP